MVKLLSPGNSTLCITLVGNRVILAYIWCIAFAALLCTAYAQPLKYRLNRGRFGDHMITYAKALWLAHKTRSTLYYTPFDYSCHLGMSKLDQQFRKRSFSSYTVKKVKTIDDILAYQDNLVLFETDLYAAPSPSELYREALADKSFADRLSKAYTPTIPVQIPRAPEGFITVALHVRRGSGPDKPEVVPDFPTKHTTFPINFVSREAAGGAIHGSSKLYFLPLQFYIDQVNLLAEILHDTFLFVTVYTDDKNPDNTIQTLRSALQNPRISIADHMQNPPSYNVLYDFYRMSKADCLIRPRSHFSEAAQLLGKHAIIIYPQKALLYDNAIPYAQEVTVLIRQGSTMFRRSVFYDQEALVTAHDTIRELQEYAASVLPTRNGQS